VLWDTDAASTDTIEKLMTLLRNRYSGARQSDKYRMEVRLLRRRPGESLSSLHQDIRRLMALAYPTLQPDARESIACNHHIDALDDADFGLKVRERAPSSLDDALRVSLQLEALMKDATRTRRDQSTKPKVRGANEAEDNEQLSARLNRLEGDMSRCLKELMRLNVASSQGAKKVETHPVVDDRKTKPRAPEPRTQRGSRRGKLVCWGGGNEGHVQRNCPHPKPHPSSETHQTPSNVAMRGCKGPCVSRHEIGW